jgi:hypothetical protein
MTADLELECREDREWTVEGDHAHIWHKGGGEEEGDTVLGHCCVLTMPTYRTWGDRRYKREREYTVLGSCPYPMLI